VERVIRSVQESFQDSGLLKKRYHATGLQTLAKLIENSYNNLPLGYHYHETAGKGPLLKMICPNHLRMGRINKRALDGPMRLPKNREEQLKLIGETYEAWFRIWRDSYVPKLMHRPKWFRSDKDLVNGDLVYFIKREGALENKWTMGMVESVKKGRDGIIREAVIKYCNSSEQKLSLGKGDKQPNSTFPRYTERSARKLIKIFSIEETSLAEDMAELSRKMTDAAANITVQVSTSRPEECEGRRYAQGECCCQDHCKLSEHHTARVKMVDMVDAVLKAVEVIDIDKPELEELDEEASTWGLGGLFASTQLNVEAVLGQRGAPARD
jgi:hypothetical protein